MKRYVVGHAVVTERDGQWLVLQAGGAAYACDDRAEAFRLARTI